MQTITPYLYYADVDAALSFLGEAFGFEETLRYTGAEGYVSHAEMRLGDAAIMMGDPGESYRTPTQLGGSTQGTHVYVVPESGGAPITVTAPEGGSYFIASEHG